LTMVDISTQLGRRIRRVRTKQGLTQEELAHRAELDYSYINQIENGRRNPSVQAIDRIARALGVRVKDLMSF
jgi:transcriptional regulator with XRE-family HTH domain